MTTPSTRLTLRDPLIWAPMCMLVLYAVALGWHWRGFVAGVGPAGQPFGHDFYCFWTAGRLVLSGQAAQVFDPLAFQAALDAGLPGQTAVLPWNYPPPYLLAVTPFAVLPLPLAYGLFQLSTGALLLAGLWRLCADGRIMTVLAASAYVIINVSYGQNGFLLAALLAWAVWALRTRRPVLAGVCIGLMTIKPHLGLLLPVALLAGRQYRAFVVAGVTAVAIWALAFGVWGGAAFQAFVGAITQMGSGVQAGHLDWRHMPTLYAGLRASGVAAPVAMALQGTVLLLAAAWVAQVWRRGPTVQAVAILGGAMVASAPYLLVYDMCLLLPGLALWAQQMAQRGPRRFERLAFVCLLLLPALVQAIDNATRLQLGALITWAGVAWTWAAMRTRASE